MCFVCSCFVWERFCVHAFSVLVCVSGVGSGLLYRVAKAERFFTSHPSSFTGGYWTTNLWSAHSVFLIWTHRSGLIFFLGREAQWLLSLRRADKYDTWHPKLFYRGPLSYRAVHYLSFGTNTRSYWLIKVMVCQCTTKQDRLTSTWCVWTDFGRRLTVSSLLQATVLTMEHRLHHSELKQFPQSQNI